MIRSKVSLIVGIALMIGTVYGEESTKAVKKEEYSKVFVRFEKNPAIAFGSSLIIPGLGQMYNGEVNKGLSIFGAETGTFGLFSLIAAADEGSATFLIIGTIIAGAFHIYQTVEAALSANRINKELWGEELGSRSSFIPYHWLRKQNRSPFIPSVLEGPSSGNAGISYTFTICASDPDGDKIAILVDWGDNTSSSWSLYVPSGSSISTSHAYSSPGTYHIKMKAKDIRGAESDWSPTRAITITGE